ncbi:MAG: pitrilysin family protein [Candidatus Eisenbacteria bacterium]
MRRKGSIAAGGLAAVLVLLFAGALHPLPAKDFKNPSELVYPPLHEIRTPPIERHVLDNGLVVYLLEDHEFPMVDYQMLVRVGQMYEPVERRGLAAVAGTVLRTGGTRTVAGDELDLRLESMGAVLEADIGATEGRVTGSFLSANAVEGLGLLADILRHPAFPEEKIDLAKVEERTAIASRNDEPIQIAIREFQRIMYGADSPYGWYPEYETIEAISRDDIVRFHQTFFQPDRMILTVFGDFEGGPMREEVAKIFADWQPAGKPLPPDPPVPPQAPEGIFYARKEGVTQSTVLFGLMGMRASDPDYAAMQLLDQVLGSGFSSRLVNEIRTERGLAYAVGSAPGAGWHHPGVWLCYLLTQSDSTVAAAGAMREAVERITREPVTEDELQMAKDIVLNELIFDLSSQREVLQRKAFYEYHGYPEDFLERYQQKVRTLTTADLLAAAQRHIHAEALAVVVVGIREDFSQPLETLGPVAELDITIPDPPSRRVIPEATSESLAQGLALLRAAAQAHGGPALAAVESVRMKAGGTVSMMGNTITVSMEELHVVPERRWQKVNIGGMFELTEAIDGDRGWAKSPGGVEDRAGEDLAKDKQDLLREFEYFLTRYEGMGWQALGPQELDGQAYPAALAREVPIQEWIVYFDPGTHLVKAMEYRGQGPQGAPAHIQAFFSDYREVGGAKWPFERKILVDGEEFFSIVVESIDLNGPVDAALFQKPE